MKNALKFFLPALILLGFTQGLMANEKTDLKNDFLEKIDEVIHIVEDQNMSTNQRNGEIVDALAPIFDFELMAKLSLGKKTWKKLKSEEKRDFTELYVKRMETSYSSKLDAYSDEKVEVTQTKQSKKNRIVLITDLVNGNERMEIAYKFYKPERPKQDKRAWLIYDVEIQGVSILKTDKAQFKEFFTNKKYF